MINGYDSKEDATYYVVLVNRIKGLSKLAMTITAVLNYS